MKRMIIIKVILTIVTMLMVSCTRDETPKPRVFVFTDINIDSGDPDDRQSLVHLLWYSNELEIEGIVPDRWDARGLEACQQAIAAYEKDFNDFLFDQKGYPSPNHIRGLLAIDLNDAIIRFQKAASSKKIPLYVLVWGNMVNFGKALNSNPHLAENIRLITIGTNLMMEEYRRFIPNGWQITEKPCEQYNWNSQGRNQIYYDQRYKQMWWLEINWTYEGMFTGNQPTEILKKLKSFGAMGQHISDVVKNETWAQYFRVGDTPSVLYVIDPNHDLNDPTQSSWAGQFKKPFPVERPNYYTDYNGNVDWDYSNPCNTWKNHVAFCNYAKSTLETRRQEMYNALLIKLKLLYNQ
ncbi:MAG: DUF1593 domain-containing protein [Bacteroidales bacterium]|nr:DUF1593 domain-containing protein [Bacteroidales bacterium]